MKLEKIAEANDGLDRECHFCMKEEDDEGNPLRLTACGPQNSEVCKTCYYNFTQRLPDWAQAEADAQITDVHLDEPRC